MTVIAVTKVSRKSHVEKTFLNILIEIVTNPRQTDAFI